MKTICFIVPYFGKLPDYFQVWLDSCRVNKSVHWLVFTNDETEFNYPPNVSRILMTFDELRNKIQTNFDFLIRLDSPYKLCDYKIAYGDIFKNELEGYDFWGFCDIDLIWGNIREFYTDDLLNKYDKIGNQGHATIFRNNEHVNLLYKEQIEGQVSYRTVMRDSQIYATDKEYISNICTQFKIPVFADTIYAGLEKYKAGFYLQCMPAEDGYKNGRQVFEWNNGTLTRWFLDKGRVVSESYLYIHFFSRPMKNEIANMDRILIYPDVYKNFYGEITPELVKKYGKKSELVYLYRVFMQNKNRLSVKKVISYFAIKLGLYTPENPTFQKMIK